MSVNAPAPHTDSYGASSAPSSSAVAAPSAPVDATAGTETSAPVTSAVEGTSTSASPAQALEPITSEPSILDKAQALAKPYLEKVEPYAHKVQEATKPYTDAAAAKTKEIIDKIEGNAPSTSPVPTSSNTAEKSIDSASSTTADAAEKAKNLFGQGLSAVQSTFQQITHTIDEKTASPSHPGFITQVTNAVHKGVEKVEKAFNEATEPGAGAPATGSGTAHPVQTTTNSVPHVPVISAFPQ
ncbi:hypothetical protein IAU60_002120 [Kwoniella sp. DSM 27419]